MKSREKPLNDKTPRWFKDWHNIHYRPVRDRTLRNERLIYIILIAIIGAAMVNNSNIDLFGRIVRAVAGG